MQFLETFAYVCLCAAIFSLAIAIHEFGHFLAAVKLGLRVERFSIGFGPAIWKRKWRGVEYRISWIPLGGYVMIPDIDPDGTKALEGGAGGGSRTRVPAWKELVVALAGPAMNIVLAAVVAIGLSLVPDARFGRMEAVVDAVLPDSPAEAAGFEKGDRIVAVNGVAVDSWIDMQTEFQIAGEREVPVRIDRAGVTVEVRVAPRRDEVTEMCTVGIVRYRDRDGSPSTWLPVRNPWGQMKYDACAIFRVLKGLVTPKEMASTGKAIGGPVLIAQGIYNSMRDDFCNGLGFFRFLNVNLAVVNLLPIPVLDGGLILFALIALVFRRRVPAKIVDSLSMVFMALLLLAMAFLTYRDGIRTWRLRRFSDSIKAKAAAAAHEGAPAAQEGGDGPGQAD